MFYVISTLPSLILISEVCEFVGDMPMKNRESQLNSFFITKYAKYFVTALIAITGNLFHSSVRMA